MKYFFLFLFGSVLLSCNNSNGNASEELVTEEITFTKEGTLQIHKADSTTIPLDIEFAETDYETATGLMYRDAIEENQGMLFLFSSPSIHTFYMKNTEFPLDIIYITADKKIATIAADAKPFNEESLSSEVPVQYVLEVNGGLAKTWNVKVGDSISWARNK
ncbi:DUF192 domain-containing protein [Flavimarina sp. Hel_I_48]|uniref:DUF192 domain-containing protein n=1 Tax=Flavimarina sp. Hel_I_48 TaxID=1392488 RepID=UPI0005696359|nr:DUF192 domain-containing protein [Flavimarina sp. Hel_I_48]